MRGFKKKVWLSKQPWINKRRRKRTRDDRSQPNHIPLDITLEILSRLSAKSIVRYRCVSKLWSSLTRLPSFINSFASLSSSGRPCLLLTFSSGYKQYGISFPHHQNPDGSYPPFYCYQIKNPSDWSYTLPQSVQGLILLPGFKIWNPTLRRFSALPHPKKHIPSQNCKSFLGYDPLEDKHKVLCILHYEYSKQLWVLTLGAQESWRIIAKASPRHHPGAYGRCFNGVWYYEASVDDQDIIMSFDVKSENFNPIKFPEGFPRLHFHMIPHEGRLALVTNTYGLQDVDLYILKDADGHEWKRQRLPHIRCKSGWRNRMNFKGVTDAGELIFAPSRLAESYYILYFDPRRNSTREALFKGIVGEIRRCCGLATNHLYTMDVFPNHIESLVSL